LKVSTARNIALALKLLFGAGWGFLIVGNIAGAILGGLFAYTLVVSYPRPFTTFRESLRVNWRSFCLLGGILGLIVVRYALHMAEAEAVLKAFSAGFVGVLCGEMFGGIIVGFASKNDQPSDPKDEKKD
jgi:MFS family permease